MHTLENIRNVAEGVPTQRMGTSLFSSFAPPPRKGVHGNPFLSNAFYKEPEMSTFPILGKISAEHFLDTYWQKKPLLIPQAIPDFQSPISADELAGLSLEPEVESRLILEHGNTPWELRHGPFTEECFATLPEKHWTLLVQAVDHWVPEVRELLEQFHFLPGWRLDDIMISYAADGGNVGPHFDQYDVFLLQAEGKRRWQIGPVYNEHSPTLKDTPLHILSEFEVQQDYVLEPGDMLYLPPGVGHHGVAEGECMTISIGFRAPSHRDILMQFTDFVADQLPERLRYSDADQQLPKHSLEIGDDAIDRIQSILQQYTQNRTLLAEWFGKHMTAQKYEGEPQEQAFSNWQELTNTLDGEDLYLGHDTRIAFHKPSKSIELFINGELFTGDHSETQHLIRQLSDDHYLDFEHWSSLSHEPSQSLILKLVNIEALMSSN